MFFDYKAPLLFLQKTSESASNIQEEELYIFCEVQQEDF